MIENNTYRFLNGLQSLGWKLGLNNITELVDYLGNPHVEQKYVHIAGTNGKGSTAAMLESILRAGGYKTGLFTSPHLIDVRERIKCNGENIPMTKLVAYVDELKSFVIAKGCTYFETTTAIALKYFSDCCVDFAVIEVGMGGRFDATNIITPLLSIITEIDFDHTEHLGKDYYSIAKEKAGIIKQDIPCLVQSRNQEALRAIAEVAQSKQSKLFKLSDMITVKDYQLFETFSKADLT